MYRNSLCQCEPAENKLLKLSAFLRWDAPVLVTVTHLGQCMCSDRCPHMCTVLGESRRYKPGDPAKEEDKQGNKNRKSKNGTTGFPRSHEEDAGPSTWTVSPPRLAKKEGSIQTGLPDATAFGVQAEENNGSEFVDVCRIIRIAITICWGKCPNTSFSECAALCKP